MDASSEYFQEKMELDIMEKKTPIKTSLTESGNILINVLDSPQFNISSEFSRDIATIKGRTLDGANVEVSNTVVSLGLQLKNEGGYQYIDSISSPFKIEIDGTNEYVSYENENISIKFDVLGFKPFDPQILTDKIELIDRETWSAVASPVDGIDDRIEFIKSNKIFVRTAEVVITLDKPGCIAHQVDAAREKIEKLLELSGFVQGVRPNFVRAELVGVDDEPPDSVRDGLRYEILWATQGDIGGLFKTKRLVWGNEFPQYLNAAYENYDSHVQNELKLKNVLGYYWDALNSTRPVEGRYLSVCSAIELLAKRYSDLYNQQSRTQDRIEYLVDRLGVETEDLAEFAGTTKKSLSSVYFYSHSRQYVVHGDNNPTWRELRNDFEAALTLLQRIIRNQLIGSIDELSNYDELANIEPTAFVDFK